MNKRFYEKTYPAIWNQYIFLSKARDRMEKKIDFLLLLTGIFMAAFVSLGLYDNTLNWPSLVGIGFIFILAIYRIIPRRVMVPWVSEEEYMKYENKLSSEKLHKQLINEVYEYIHHMNAYINDRIFILKLMVFTFILAVAVPVIVFISNSFEMFWVFGPSAVIAFLVHLNSIFHSFIRPIKK